MFSVDRAIFALSEILAMAALFERACAHRCKRMATVFLFLGFGNLLLRGGLAGRPDLRIKAGGLAAKDCRSAIRG